MKIEAVIFDYGNVLSLPQPEGALKEMAAKCGLSLDVLEKHYWDVRAEYDSGDISGSDYWHELARRGGAMMTSDLARELIELDNRSWSRENTQMSAFARDVRARGFRTAILSNMPLDFRNFLPVGVTWLPEFDHHTYSCELRASKPDLRIYEHSISGLGIDPQHAVFIDDREANVEAALKAGWQAVLFVSTQQALDECSKLCGLSVTA